jgi:hypothetical protein
LRAIAVFIKQALIDQTGFLGLNCKKKSLSQIILFVMSWEGGGGGRRPQVGNYPLSPLFRGGIQERTVGLKFLGIILRVLRLEVSTLVLCLSTRCSS